MKKRAFAAILVTVMCMQVTACGTEVEGTIQAVETAASVASETEAAPETEVTAETVSETEVTAETEVEFTMGSQNGVEYVSEFAGLKIVVPDNWKIASENELSQMNGWTTFVENEEVKKQLESAGVIYDYMSQSETGANINVVCQSVGKLFGNALFEEQIIEATVKALPKQYKQVGYDEVTLCKADKMNIAGKERNVIVTEGTFQGVKISQVQIFVLKGGYNWVATLTVFPEADTNTTMDDLIAFVQEM